MSDNPNLPTYQRPEVKAAVDDLTLIHDLLGGTRRMWQQSKEYIRKWSDEDTGVYDIRRQCETLFEGLGRILSAAVGMLFAKSPALEWNASEAVMTPQWDNIDAAGTKGTVFIKRFSESAIRDGLCLILVDHPSPPQDVTITAANEQTLGLRPTWAMYQRAQILSWRTAVVGNRQTVTQLVLAECGETASGTFGVTTRPRYRVLRLVDGVATWQLWEQVNDRGASLTDFALLDEGTFKNRNGKSADFLPVALGYAGRTDSPITAGMPLLGVAWANLAHWQLSTNLRFYRDLSAFPQPVVTGALMPDPQTGQPGKLRVGPMVAVQLSEASAKFEWAELSGSSMAQLEQGVDEKLGQMAKLGMAFLATDTRAAETAAAKRLDATAENSTLATAAQGIEDAVNLAFEYHAWYLGIEKAGAPVLTISRDYESTAMDPATMTAYVSAVQSAGLPIRLLLEAWQAGGRIGPEEDLDALEAEMMANAEAAAQQKANELAAQQDAMKNGQPDPTQQQTKQAA